MKTNTVSNMEMSNVFNFKDYSGSVERMSLESLVKLCHSKEFRNAYGPYKKALDKKAMLTQAIERLEILIEGGLIPMELRLIPGMDRSIAIIQRAWDESVKGMQSLSKTEAQAIREKSISFVEKTVNIGRVCHRLRTLLSNGKTKSLFNLLELGPLFYQIVKVYTGVTKAGNNFKGVAESMGVLVNYTKAMEDISHMANFIRTNNLSTKGINGIFVHVAYNGFNIEYDPTRLGMVNGLAYGARKSAKQVLNLTPDTLSKEQLTALSHILVQDEYNNIWRYNISKHGEFGVSLHNRCNSLTLLQVMFLKSWKNIEFASLLADSRNWVVLTHRVSTIDGSSYLTVSDTPFTELGIMSLNLEGKYWGVSNPDTFHKGIIRSNSSYKGFAELDENGDIITMAEKGNTNKDGTRNGDASKLVARVIKLDKLEGELVTLPLVFVATDIGDSKLARDALSSGAVQVCSSIFEKYGQCRFTSAADKGGMKGTFGPMNLVDVDLDALDISLTSFASMKANKYALCNLLGLEESDDLPIVSQYFSNFGCALEGVFVENMEVMISNNYIIENFRPSNRDALLQDWDMANEVLAARATAKISNLNEDAVFLAYIQEARDTEFNGNLVDCLKTLEMRGSIKRKPNTTTVTSSEFDMMVMSHGKEVAEAWMDNLLADKLNTKDTEKAIAFTRAIEIYTGLFNSSDIITVEGFEFLEQFRIICTRHGIKPGSITGKFLSRDFLVDICTNLFYYGTEAKWLDITLGSSLVRLPLGEMLTGNFHTSSSMFETRVVVTGFLSKFFEKSNWVMKAYTDDNPKTAKYKEENVSKYFGFMAINLYNEVVADVWCKELGRLNATGLYAVLSPAWWTETDHVITIPGADKRFSESKKAIFCKHPLLFDMSLAGVEVESKFPKQLTKGLSKEAIESLNFVFSSTVFCPASMLLALQNDCDGDLGRITWHKDFSIENFSTKVLEEDSLASGWFNNYVQDEQNFDNVKDVVWSNRTIEDLAVAMTAAQQAKNSVASYTNNAQLFAQRCEVDLGLSKESIEYHAIHRILNIWVQEFSMMAIKHNQTKVNEATEEMFGDKPVSSLKLPDFYMISTLQMLKLTGEESNPGEAQLVAWLDDKGIDTRHHGLESNEEFALYFHKVLCGIGKRSPAVTILAKDHKPSAVGDMEGIGCGTISDFNPTILQDRLLLKSLAMRNVLVMSVNINDFMPDDSGNFGEGTLSLEASPIVLPF